jgi:hypothetical protein
MISSKHVNEESVVLFDRVQVDYEGSTYAGTGFGRWEPARGLLVNGMTKLVRGDGPLHVKVGTPIFMHRPNLSTVRFRAGPHHRAVIFLDSPLRDQLGILFNGHLELRSSQFISWARDVHPPERPIGCLFFRGKHGCILPHDLKTEVHLGKRKVRETYENGLDFKRDGYEFAIRDEDDQTHTIWWRLPDVDSLRGRIGEWPRALALAWQMIRGKSAWPVASDIQDMRRRIVVFTRHEEAIEMGHLELLDSQERTSGATLLALAKLFVCGSQESDVAKRLLSQCFDAVRSKTWQGVMFLMGTALEAVLRTLYGHPFCPNGQTKYNRHKCMDQLWIDYFDEDSQDVKKRVKAVFDRIRHRSAHPDWLRSFGGASSSDQEAKTFDDLVFMSRFYGYLIMAMAGVPLSLTRFPAPVADWKPTITYSRGTSEAAEEHDCH